MSALHPKATENAEMGHEKLGPLSANSGHRLLDSSGVPRLAHSAYLDFQRRIVAIEAWVYSGEFVSPPKSALLVMIFVVKSPPT